MNDAVTSSDRAAERKRLSDSLAVGIYTTAKLTLAGHRHLVKPEIETIAAYLSEKARKTLEENWNE